MNTTSSTASQHRTAAQRAIAEHLRLLSTGQIQEWVHLFASDGTLEFPYAPKDTPRRLKGHDELLAYMSHFPEMFDVNFVDLIFHDTAHPRLAIAEFASTGRALTTGKPYEQTCISVVHVDDQGRITRYVDYWNPLVAMEALEPAASS
jgi:ketosteroid isomerase-like protein